MVNSYIVVHAFTSNLYKLRGYQFHNMSTVPSQALQSRGHVVTLAWTAIGSSQKNNYLYSQ
jgi:hypothetical protein